MGCFDSTCAITRTAIHNGDKCYIFIWPNWTLKTFDEVEVEPTRSTYEGLQSIRKEPDEEAKWRWFRDQEKCKLASLSREDLDVALNAAWDSFPLVWSKLNGMRDYTVLYGTYNDYGWLKEHENHPLKESARDSFRYKKCLPYFYVHAEIVEHICLCANVDMADPMAIAEAVHQYAFIRRIQLYSPDHLLGTQYDYIDEFEAQLELAELTVRLLKDRIASYRHEYGEVQKYF